MTEHLEYLELDDLLAAIRVGVGPDATIRDIGLLEAALARPRASAFGEDAYPDLDTKAAAFLSSLVRDHPLVDGNKRLGWVAVRLFYALNDRELRAPVDDAEALVMALARGDLVDVAAIGATLATWCPVDVALAAMSPAFAVRIEDAAGSTARTRAHDGVDLL